MNKVQIGANVRKWRNFRGIKQPVLASKVKVCRNTLSRWENGRREIPISILPVIADELNISVAELFSEN